jgi:pSer/pThr/pTyr-binding forkhead associated (FHA) protein
VTPLTAYITRYLEGGLEKALSAPMLLVEPSKEELEAAKHEEYQFQTESGVGTPAPGKGAPYVLEVRKHKNNAFQRGITVGRTGNNDLIIDDGSVSRFHAWFQLDRESGLWCVADAGSKNGTRLGRNRLPAKKLTTVKGGDRLRFGKVGTIFLLPKDFVAVLKTRLNA